MAAVSISTRLRAAKMPDFRPCFYRFWSCVQYFSPTRKPEEAFLYLLKSEEGHAMPFRKSTSMDWSEAGTMAEGWGKIVARRVHEEVGADLDLDADDMEQVAKSAACAVAKGTIEERLERKASLLGSEQPCPTCRRLCPVQRTPRSIQFWGGEVQYREPQCHCPACRRDFFPSASGSAAHTP
jgi:hypothetical protein